MPHGTNADSSWAKLGELWRGITQSLTVRVALIGFVAIVMFIPLESVHSLVRERNGLHTQAIADITRIWGGEQVVRGPVLAIPYVERFQIEETETDEDGHETIRTRVKDVRRTAIALPKRLDLDFRLGDEFRHRGIYDALVYTSELALRGHFETPDLSSLSSDLHVVEWEKAYLSFALSDTGAIQSASDVRFDGADETLSPGTQLPGLLGSGFHVPLAIDPEEGPYPFELDLSFRGSGGLRFAPFGETTDVTMASTWPHPSFQGATLPTSYGTTETGFEARWSIPHLTRNYGQLFALGQTEAHLDEFLAGVDLFEPVYLYSKVTRAVKYGPLFILLTFLVFLAFELVAGVRMRVVQYGLIGLAMTLFYLTLLSLAEHVAFFGSYLAATAINVGMISLYAGATTRSWGRAAIVFAVLSGLYALLFSLLHMESYALLLGTLLLLVVVAVLMVLTRNLEHEELAATPAT